MSATMARLLQTLRQDYDLVLLDTPPAEAITDARIVAGLADATLFCVRWRATSRQAALHALELLEEAHANVVGAALTQVDVNVHVRSGYADAEVYHPSLQRLFPGVDGRWHGGSWSPAERVMSAVTLSRRWSSAATPSWCWTICAPAIAARCRRACN